MPFNPLAGNSKRKVNDEEFLLEAQRIVKLASERGITLRIAGSVAICIHSTTASDKFGRLRKVKRTPDDVGLFKDLDLVGYSKQRSEVTRLFQNELGFQPDQEVNTLFGHKRMIFFHKTNDFSVDIFFDKFEFSHDIYFGDKPEKSRLEIDFPTIPLDDILLTKLQIHDVTKTDLADILFLLLHHEIHDGGENKKSDSIDATYISQMLSDDWGFWYEATNNLKMMVILASDEKANMVLPESDFSEALAKANDLLGRINSFPKTQKWIKRSNTGAKKQWFQDVEDVDR